jgi:hypothetical protein
MMTTLPKHVLTFVLILFAVASPAFESRAQIFLPETTADAGYAVSAYRLSETDVVVLDGRLTEPFWQKIAPVTNFRQQEPIEGAAPSESTEVYVAFDDQNLYIGVLLFDSEPERIVAWNRRRNHELDADDRFQIVLDTFYDGRYAYFFEINPAGLRGDGLLTTGQGGGINKAWDGIWDVRVSIDESGWSAEIQIPFRSIDFDPGNTAWGINFRRTIRRKNEEIVWSGWRRNQGIFRPANAGVLTGLEGLNQGVGLEFTPYAAGGGSRIWNVNGGHHAEWSTDAGFDLSYNINPGVRTLLTVNTDFAETEVDQRRVNLTRFPLFFPEQRDFFLEGAGIFSFAPGSDVTPFFSRRIGLHEGMQVPVNVGAKLLGRQGDTVFGAYQIRTGRTVDIDAEDFTAARIKQNIFRESAIGLIYTRRYTHGGDPAGTRHTLGADLELNTSRFLGDKNLQFEAFLVWNNARVPGEGSDFRDRTGRGFRLAYPNYPFYGHVSYREFGAAYDPAVGFASRAGFRRFQPTVGYQHIMTGSRVVRSLETSLRFEYLTDLAYNPETVDVRLTPVDIRFESGERIVGVVGYNFEDLPIDFDILRNGSIIIPAGDYRNGYYGFNAYTAGYRMLSGTAGIWYEDFWTGMRTLYDLSVTFRPFTGVNLSGSWARSDANLAEGSFMTDLYRFNGNIDLTPNTAFTSIIQFDNLSSVLGFYNRFRWTLRPGADMYIVHTYNFLRTHGRFDPIETQGALKLNFTHRF